ncbi:benzoate transporter [Azospirillum baldaniorum]|uniref:benzoate/H(+) symporter BenE family transporter n=1 Tax=Azospirillum baldaniorum TaxID=1064539 RepID=UPI000D600837|nr:benzoate/H(+) symporter BenE family transporter [Azospirillum baldaniorum]AWJ90139.1 benzoate transporter [Azospirillum baldaniorum]TWA77317.1 benzoate membrane transport protein [Azospirillum brasilense]
MSSSDTVPATDLSTGLSLRAVGAGLLAALVGYASSVAVVIHGLTAVGASTEQVVSGLVLLGFAMGLTAMGLSLHRRKPISIAWTTPGMALLAATGAVEGGFPAAVGAFIATGVLIILAGLWSPLGRWIAAIPKPLANGMLAGILLKLCLAPFLAVSQAPGMALLVLATWAVVGRVARLYAVPAAVAVALGAMALDSSGGLAGGAVLSGALWPGVTFVQPVFTWEAMVGIALPLFVVTMASQNIPGLAVLATYNYAPPTRPIFLATGAASALTALGGAPTINLAAITAALCASPDADPNPARRWQAAFVGGIGYILFAGLAGVTAVMVTRSPPILIEAVAGLALVGAFGAALMGAVQVEANRTAALVTMLVTASGLSVAGVGSAFWGLLLGGAVHLLHWRPSVSQPAK